MNKLSDKPMEFAKSIAGDEYWKRLQIGGAGIFGIVLVAGITSLVLSNADDTPPLDPLLAEQQKADAVAEAQDAEQAPSEPLVDIGVVPDIAPDQSLGDPDEALPKDKVPDLPSGDGENGPDRPASPAKKAP